MEEGRKPGPEDQWQRILGRCNERVGHIEALLRVGGEALVAAGGSPSVADALASAAEGGAFTHEDIDALRLTAAREAESELHRHARERQVFEQQGMALERLTRSLADEVDRRVQAEVEAARAQAKADRAVTYAAQWRTRAAQAEQSRNGVLQVLRDLVQEILRRLPGAAKTRMFERALGALDGKPVQAVAAPPDTEALALLAEAVTGKVEAWDEWFRRADRVVEAAQGRAPTAAEERTTEATLAPAVTPASAPVTRPMDVEPLAAARPPSGEEFAVAARNAEFDQHIEIDPASDLDERRDDAQSGGGAQRAPGGKPAAR